MDPPTLNYTSYSEEENVQTLDFVNVYVNVSNGMKLSKSHENEPKYAHRLQRLHTRMMYSLICYTSHALVSDFLKNTLILLLNC